MNLSDQSDIPSDFNSQNEQMNNQIIQNNSKPHNLNQLIPSSKMNYTLNEHDDNHHNMDDNELNQSIDELDQEQEIDDFENEDMDDDMS